MSVRLRRNARRWSCLWGDLLRTTSQKSNAHGESEKHTDHEKSNKTTRFWLLREASTWARKNLFFRQIPVERKKNGLLINKLCLRLLFDGKTKSCMKHFDLSWEEKWIKMFAIARKPTKLDREWKFSHRFPRVGAEIVFPINSDEN